MPVLCIAIHVDNAAPHAPVLPIGLRLVRAWPSSIDEQSTNIEAKPLILRLSEQNELRWSAPRASASRGRNFHAPIAAS
jgi:hypothetical protein